MDEIDILKESNITKAFIIEDQLENLNDSLKKNDHLSINIITKYYCNNVLTNFVARKTDKLSTSNDYYKPLNKKLVKAISLLSSLSESKNISKNMYE